MGGLVQPGFGYTSGSLVVRNVERFPRKFLLLQEGREGNRENFDTFQAAGVEHEKEESEGADWSAVRKVCEQHGGARSTSGYHKSKTTTVINQYYLNLLHKND